MMAHGLVGKPVDSCFEDAEKSGKLLLCNRNLREFPNSCDKYDMEDVYIIEISNNKFKKVPDILRKCMILIKLDLHNNFLREFSSEFKNFTSLKELTLSRNSLAVFPLILTTYNLEYLDISCNRLKSIPEDIRFLEKLKVLDLSSNSLKMLPSTIGQLTNLRCLNTSRNKLERIPEELQYCPLMKLNLSFNKLHMIPPSFRHLIRLQEINLESNPLRHPPAKICSLGKAHIFKYLSLLASHMEAESNLSREEIESQKRYKEAQERLYYRPDSAIKSNFDEFEIDGFSPTISQMSLNTPSISSALDDYRLTTPDIQESFQRVDISHGQDYNSIYLDLIRRDHNSNEDGEVGFGKDDNKSSDVLRPQRSKKSDVKRRSSHYDSDQKPVLSMYATMPRIFRRSITPTGEPEGSASVRIQPRVRPVLRMSPYMRRPLENSGSEEHDYPVLDTKKTFENSQEEGQSFKLKPRQMNTVSRTESTRSSSTGGSYFTGPYAYATDLKRSTSNKYINHTPDVIMGDKNHTKNSNPSNNPPKRPKSPDSDGSTVSDTPTPRASPEPPDIHVSPLISPEQINVSKSTPPAPPPRTFKKQLDTNRTTEKGQVAKLSIEKGNSGATNDSDKYFKTKKKSPTEDEGEKNLTIKRREYNVHMLTSQIDYIVSEVKERMGTEIEDFENYIQDGVLACQLVNLVQPDLVSVHVPDKNKVLSTRQVTLNIEKFLEGCQHLGVPTNYMCTAADIMQGQDLSKVLKNFIYLLNSSAV